ncbi:elongation factor EF-2 [Candidatus Woesearchaeota archaeon]|nr:elongation factor EF-2 [Candidatus Woesearchaeota archaeon]RLE40747.1 MAG: elongation factor EF-2 [Candidatus Woesearchaeota archaeon]
MPTDEEIIQKIKDLMNKPAQIRNIGIAAHIDHGKTTLSDSLIAGAGMISEAVAGERLILDFAEDEQLRGITIDAANCSMVHSYEDKEYLINLIDTPGHVDFGGDVTRAMRAVDGAVVLVCAVEGMMPQTETVLRQALKERVKPVLFINKVDRLIKELKLTPEQMQERFIKIIAGVNKFIARIAPPEFKEKWQVSVQDGSVAFGSAYHKWALSLPYMQKHNITFKDIIEAYQTEEEWKKLFRKAPLHQIILDMVIKHLPDPVEAQHYRIPKIWHGDLDSEVGKALLNCSPDGPAAFVVTKIVVDPHAGEIASGRLFSGILQKGQEVFMNMAKKKTRVQNLYVYKGPTRIPIDKAVAGNIIGIAGLKGVYAGETVSSIEMEPFEALKHLFEPVVTKAVEAAKPSDLPKLIEVLKTVAKEDPSIQVEINEETGEHLLHGMGELHLEVIENRIRTKKGVDIKTSPPIVVYRETVLKRSPEVEGKSPNKHNKFYIVVEPLEDSIYQGIKEGEIPEMRAKKKDMALLKALEARGMSSDDARKVRDIYKGNVFMDMTRGIVHIGEVIEMVMDAFEQVMSAGPLAREPCTKMKVMLVDCKLHEDAIHRGPAQVIPAVRDAIKGAIMQARPVLFEPVQIMQFEAPAEFIGEISKIVQNRRGQMLEINQEEHQVTIKAKIPVGESFGLSNDLRSATQGRGAQFLVDQFFEKLPDELQMKIINQIRQRKGIKTE